MLKCGGDHVRLAASVPHSVQPASGTQQHTQAHVTARTCSVCTGNYTSRYTLSRSDVVSAPR